MSKPIANSTGRRKTAIARVFIREGSGSITVNGRDFEEYFPVVTHQNQVLFPLALTNSRMTYDITVTTTGEGVTGQVGAVRLGIARALIRVNPENRAALKSNGMLTRDSRAKERKKPGRPGARKRFQFSKR